MDQISLRQLRYFEALSQHRHFGKAADACAISQPALSLQMKTLEKSIGAPLIERGTRQVRLTAIGETFALRVRDVLRSVDELTEFGRSHAGKLTGGFRIGVIPTAAPYLLPFIIETILKRYPGLDIRPKEAIPPKLIDGLLDARLDAAVVALPASEQSLSHAPLIEEEFYLVRPAADIRKPVPSSDSLKEMRLLLLEEGHCFRDQALTYCNMSSSSPRSLMEGSSLSTLVQMVAAGIGVTLIPEMAVHMETRSADVSVARLKPPRPARKIGMVWRRTSPLAAELSELATLIRKGYRGKSGE